MSSKKIEKFYNVGKYKLFPICRSITGNGVRKSLRIIKKEFPKLKINEIKSQSKVFDWTIPSEWNIKDAYIIDTYGNKIIDFKENNLHVVGYSTPINKIFSKKQILKKIHSLPHLPKAIPYITSYYKKDWGFCLSNNRKIEIQKKYKDDDKFRVFINSSFKKKGNLSYGEYFIKGKSDKEILISTYICHPSMANNELSGPIVSMCLIDYFKNKKNDKSIRFLFIPETIGSIAYLSKNLDDLKKKVIAGYNLTCIGDERNYSCMFSKYGNSISDKSLKLAFKKLNIKPKIFSFLERGSDERQYNSPGIDLPIASIFRTKYGHYIEQHTSLDNFNLVTKNGIAGGFKVVKKSIEIIQKKIIPKYKVLCEPQLGRRGLYPSLSKIWVKKNKLKDAMSLMDFLQYSDGKHDLEEISKIINQKLSKTKYIYNLLKNKKLVT